MTEILSGVHQLQIPTPFPVGSVNGYLIEGTPLTLIDTGPFLKEALSSLKNQLSTIGYELKDIEQILLTHGHLDHTGLTNSICSSNMERKPDVFIHQADEDYIVDYEKFIDTRIDSYMQVITENGVPPEITRFMTKERYVSYFSRYIESYNDVTTINDGHTFETGIGQLETIWTPGHSHGSCCLISSEFNVIFTGDHVLGDISSNPSLDFDNPEKISMLTYFDSLDRVVEYADYLALPGHRSVIKDLKKRIDDLREDYNQKLIQFLQYVGKKSTSIYTLSRKMYGDYPLDSLVLAIAETRDLARILELRSKVEITFENGTHYVSQL